MLNYKVSCISSARIAGKQIYYDYYKFTLFVKYAASKNLTTVKKLNLQHFEGVFYEVLHKFMKLNQK